MDRLKTCKFIIIIFTFSLLLVSCKRDSFTNEVTWSKNISRHISDDGWVYTCEYFYYNDGSVNSTVPPVKFNAVNLRYLDEMSIQILGNGVSEETDSDMQKISSFLGYGNSETEFPSIEEIKSKKRNELSLEAIDESIFFKLLDEAISGDPHPVGKYIEYPAYALLNEQGFLDGYQFQIGYRLGMGCIDVIMIDVLYPNADSSIGHNQLSDMVKSGEASLEQLELYEQIKKIEAGIVSKNNFCYGNSNLINKEVASVKLSRLYSFLSDIENQNGSKYDASLWTK